MPQSKSFNETCLEIGLQCGFISRLRDGRPWIDAGLVESDFYEFCNLIKDTIQNNLNKETP